MTVLNKKIVNAGYATKNDLPSSYSRDERKLYQRIISVIDTYFTDDPKTAEALREKIKSELSVKKKKIMRYVHCMENSGLKDMKYFLKV